MEKFQKLFQVLSEEPELITSENISKLPAEVCAWFMIRRAEDALQGPADPDDAWTSDKFNKFISVFDRWGEISCPVWNELLMWYPEFEKYCPAEIMQEIKFIEATGHPSSFYEEEFEEQ